MDIYLKYSETNRKILKFIWINYFDWPYLECYEYDLLMNLNRKLVPFPDFLTSPSFYSNQVIWYYMEFYCYFCKAIKIQTNQLHFWNFIVNPGPGEM